jgi:ATP-binding cassette subfamily C (CFTR/MRP) protein 1
MILYGVWGILQGLFQFINGFYFSLAGAAAAKVLHQRALKNVFRAPSSFFDTTPLGKSNCRSHRFLFCIVESYSKC